MRIEFTVYGTPIPKGRPRVVRLKSGAIHTFTPDRTAAWEQSVRTQALAHKPERPLEGPLALTLFFYLPKPRSAPKKRLLPDRRPDLDNLVKAVKDALNGLMWRDDAQIVSLWAQKSYGTPGVMVAIYGPEEASKASNGGGMIADE